MCERGKRAVNGNTVYAWVYHACSPRYIRHLPGGVQYRLVHSPKRSAVVNRLIGTVQVLDGAPDRFKLLVHPRLADLDIVRRLPVQRAEFVGVGSWLREIA